MKKDSFVFLKNIHERKIAVEGLEVNIKWYVVLRNLCWEFLCFVMNMKHETGMNKIAV